LEAQYPWESSPSLQTLLKAQGIAGAYGLHEVAALLSRRYGIAGPLSRVITGSVDRGPRLLFAFQGPVGLLYGLAADMLKDVPGLDPGGPERLPGQQGEVHSALVHGIQDPTSTFTSGTVQRWRGLNLSGRQRAGIHPAIRTGQLLGLEDRIVGLHEVQLLGHDVIEFQHTGYDPAIGIV